MTKIEQKIPEGWSVRKIIDVCPLQRGFDLPEQNIKSGNYPIVYSNGIKGTHNEYKATAPGVVTGRSGTIGKVTYVEQNYWPHNTSLWVTDFKGNNPKFIFYKLQNLNYAKFNSGSGVPTLNRNDVHIEKILLPPLAEQEKIAEILSCWDDEIEKLSALIEKKKIQKKALMQQLLTGKHRLKDFSTPWHEVKLKDILYEHKETSKGDETICSVSVHKGIISQIEHLGRSFAASNTSNYNLVHYGDVVYTKSPTGEFPYGIFKQSQQRKSVIVSPLYGVFTPKTYYLGYILDVFFSYAINLNNYLKPIIQKGAKNTINITNETFLSKAIFLPEETTEIQKLAEIFIKADEEINLLNQKLEALKEQKKGLMQQLLTGKIRVKVN